MSTLYEAPTIGTVDGVAIPRGLLDQRLAKLRRGPAAGLLPAEGSAEARQLVRWVSQVLFVEGLCQSESRRRGIDESGGPPVRIDPLAAVELGSVVSAAWESSESVRLVAADVTGIDIGRGPDGLLGWPLPRPDGGAIEYRLRHRVVIDETEAVRLARSDAGALEPMGWVRAAELPPALAACLHERPGRLIGPARSSLGWHVAAIDEVRQVLVPVTADRAEQERSAARQVFQRWLAVERTSRISNEPGFEHPGDPSQPDNHHRH